MPTSFQFNDMTGIIEFGGIWKKRSRVFGVPTYWIFRMYSNAAVTRLVESGSNGQSYDIDQGSIRLPKIRNVPYLDVVAASNSSGSKLTLFCVNRHLTRDIETKLDITGSQPTNATPQSIFAGSIYEKNDETEPEHIHPRETSLSSVSPEFAYTFSHESMTVLNWTVMNWEDSQANNDDSVPSSISSYRKGSRGFNKIPYFPSRNPMKECPRSREGILLSTCFSAYFSA